MEQNFIFQVKEELRKNASEKTRKTMLRFFKEDPGFIGLNYPVIRKISKKYYKEIEDLNKKEFIALCEKLLKNGKHEEKIVAFDWSFYYRENYSIYDFNIFEKWIFNYVTDWGLCDSFAPKTINYFITKWPILINETKKWTDSKKLYVRRAAAVCFLSDGGGARPTEHRLKDIFYVAEKLLKDKEDYVQKGYGWLLKNASKKHPKEVIQFVMRHKNEMPRTALRYAIEYYPKEIKKHAMSKS